jgi:UDP-MurNAc hydroxylase
VSHEHPDHFHFPTLKSLPTEFKKRVTLLFQDNNSDKMPNAFKMLGFANIQLLKNRKITQITEKTKIHNYQVGQMDSSLAVLSEGKVVLNLNDCEINTADAKNYMKDLGEIDLLLNQFSMAGYNGQYEYAKYLPKQAQTILDTMVENHKDLNASITVPIASYIYFCQQDNKFMNMFGNKPVDIHKAFLQENLDCIFLNINQEIDLNHVDNHDKIDSFKQVQALYENLDEKLEFEELKSVSIEEIKEAFLERQQQIEGHFSRYFLKKAGSMKVYIPDLNKKVQISLADGTFKEYQGNEFDIQINSQPFFFSFKFKWGLQTLGVSARYLLKNNVKTWKWYRIITSLNNAEIYLKPKYFFTKNTFLYFFSRASELPNQLRYQLSRMN